MTLLRNRSHFTDHILWTAIFFSSASATRRAVLLIKTGPYYYFIRTNYRRHRYEANKCFGFFFKNEFNTGGEKNCCIYGFGHFENTHIVGMSSVLPWRMMHCLRNRAFGYHYTLVWDKKIELNLDNFHSQLYKLTFLFFFHHKAMNVSWF